ncbi:serine protease snake [Nilaparvata lugens]|uniref:serine protease snake n=1 Tax=Nilaparvata lugens TaxID=108931 RepID=UPI00193DF737|nr:serine protease snake [Nilaparvata lugens]
MELKISFIILTFFVFSGSAQLNLFEDDVCKEVDEVEWTCKRLENCASALRVIKQKRPEMCGFSGSSVVVCCEPSDAEKQSTSTTMAPTRRTTPRTTTTTARRPLVKPTKPPTPPPNARISLQKCYEYARSVFQPRKNKPLILELEEEKDEESLENTCGITEKALIIGGKPSSPREFPHQANLGYTFSNTIKWLCTGSLISENFVLSAAHCSKTRYGAPAYAVLGDLDVESDSDDARPQRMRIVDHIEHPRYRAEDPYNDITLYRLEKHVLFDEYTRPACLNSVRYITEKQAVATGWGFTRTGGLSSSELLKVRLNIINQTQCSQYWSKGGQLRQGIDDERMICAGDLQGKKDTCNGDSGGPLQNALSTPYCMYNVIGVTSFGRRECGSGAPGVYTRVSYYLPWIESIVWPQNSTTN